MSYPIKLSAKTEWFPILTIVTTVAFSIYFYMHFGSQVPIHWDASGQPNGYGNRFVGAFFPTFITLGIYLLFFVFPLLDPRRDRYAEFSKAFLLIRDCLVALMLAVGLVAGYAALGYNVQINSYTPLVVGVLFLLLGNYMGKIKNNWFMGIRNPWTLSNENVWNKTNRLGGWLFSLLGLLTVITVFFAKEAAFIVLIAGVVIIILITTVYSYYEYSKLA